MAKRCVCSPSKFRPWSRKTLYINKKILISLTSLHFNYLSQSHNHLFQVCRKIETTVFLSSISSTSTFQIKPFRKQHHHTMSHFDHVPIPRSLYLIRECSEPCWYPTAGFGWLGFKLDEAVAVSDHLGLGILEGSWQNLLAS